MAVTKANGKVEIPTDVDDDTLHAAADDSLEYLTIFKPAETGIQRLREIFQINSYGFRSFEWTFVSEVISSTFVVGMIIGGLRKHKQSVTRFVEYNQGTLYQSHREGAIRFLDYANLMFMKNGIVLGSKTAVLTGTISTAMACVAAYRDHFSLYYSPLSSTVAGALYKFHMGPRGMLAGGTGGLLLGLIIYVFCLPFGWFSGMTFDEIYKAARQMHFTQTLNRMQDEAEIRKIMKEENIWLRFNAKKALAEKKAFLESQSQDLFLYEKKKKQDLPNNKNSN